MATAVDFRGLADWMSQPHVWRLVPGIYAQVNAQAMHSPGYDFYFQGFVYYIPAVATAPEAFLGTLYCPHGNVYDAAGNARVEPAQLSFLLTADAQGARVAMTGSTGSPIGLEQPPIHDPVQALATGGVVFLAWNDNFYSSTALTPTYTRDPSAYLHRMEAGAARELKG